MFSVKNCFKLTVILVFIIVFGTLTGDFIAKNIKNYNINQLSENYISKKIEKVTKIFGKNVKNISLENIRNKIKRTNQEYVGIFRNKKLLSKALDNFSKLQTELKEFRISDTSLTFNNELILYFEIKNLLNSSIYTCFSALNREESRGSHFREDYKERDDDNFRCHSIVKKDKNDKLLYLKRKVRDKFLDEDVIIKIKKRQY